MFPYEFDIFQYGDNCGYMSLGVALSQGEGYTDPALPGKIHFLWWPPGFPTAIALFHSIFGPNWALLKLLIFIGVYVGFVLFARVLYEGSAGLRDSALVLAAVSLSSQIHLLSSYLFSEIFYVTMSLLFFYVWHRWRDSLTVGRIVVLSFFALWVASVRNIGLSLPLALTAYLALRRGDGGTSWRRYLWLLPLSLLAVYAVCVLTIPQLKVESFACFFGLHPKFGHEATSGDTAGLWSLLASRTDRWLGKVPHSLRGYGLSLIPQAVIRSSYDLWSMSKLKAVVMLLVTATVFAGWVVTLRRFLLENLYVALVILVLMVYGPLYVRLLVPIVPFLFRYFYSGLKCTVELTIRNRKAATVILTVLWCCVIGDNAARTFTDPHRTMPAQFGDREYQQCLAWVIEEVPPGEVVVSQVHSYLYLKRGEYSLPYLGATTPDEVVTYLDCHDVDYLIVSPFYQRPTYTFMDYVRQAAAHYPDRFRRVYGGRHAESYVLRYEGERTVEKAAGPWL